MVLDCTSFVVVAVIFVLILRRHDFEQDGHLYDVQACQMIATFCDTFWGATQVSHGNLGLNLQQQIAMPSSAL